MVQSTYIFPLTLKEILEQHRALINNARDDGMSLTVAYVDETGQPRQSLRGSVQVCSDHQLCLWLRNPQGGLPNALRTNPRLSLIYRNDTLKTTLMFEGRAHVDEELRDRVYELTPARERGHDPDKRGAAVIVDLDRVKTLYGKVPTIPGREKTFEHIWP
jgi:hypothetical protein